MYLILMLLILERHGTFEALITSVKIFILVIVNNHLLLCRAFLCFSLTIVVLIKCYFNDNNSLKH